ncbi:MAG: ferredoxin III, nif-specific [Candidatus Accumulibacter sp.]|uniref:Ferredoxin III n=1 Tax=Candidatus Accumulibacter proximus TaxID=2954385 RepID=A0A935UG57_9PROT|nr:ferredoxin III, nif-specific [Candidatus Accumulibacter proximus]
MTTITGRTRGGYEWVPQFVSFLDPKKCIGCGRCYKVCPRTVLDLVERSEQLLADADDDDDQMDDDDEMMVMTIANGADCIGCGACGRVCPKDCYTYAPAEG